MYVPNPNNSRKADCHPDRPHLAKGLCYQCYRAARAKLPEQKLQHKIRNIRYRTKTPEFTADVHRLRRYGITAQQFQQMQQKQNGRCHICLKPFTSTPVIDHCHRTGKVRSLLCRHCNSGIGFLEDNPFTTRRALAYLAHHAEDFEQPPDAFADLPSRGQRKQRAERAHRSHPESAHPLSPPQQQLPEGQ